MKSSIWGAYLEDYGLIKIIVPVDTVWNNIVLEGENYSEQLILEKKESFSNELYLFCKYSEDIKLHKDYCVIVNDKNKFHVKLGKITRSK